MYEAALPELKPEKVTLLDKPMERLEFLAYLGAGLLTVTGISGVVKTVRGRVNGYSSGAYGGQKR
jgi:hypothetical protein